MDTGILHTHKLIVVLFILAMIASLVFVLKNKNNPDATTPKWLKISHMVLGTLLLGTGLFLMFRSPLGKEPFSIVKLVLVLVSMPLGIVGGRKKSVPLILLAMLLVVVTVGVALTRPAFLRSFPDDLIPIENLASDKELDNNEKLLVGKSLYYYQSCKSCHGDDGTAGFQKAKNLQAYSLDDAGLKAIVRDGKKVMPANPDLSDSEIDHLIYYIKSLGK